jgi:hypothetical protein
LIAVSEQTKHEIGHDDGERGEQRRERWPQEPLMGLKDATEQNADTIERNLQCEDAKEEHRSSVQFLRAHVRHRGNDRGSE